MFNEIANFAEAMLNGKQLYYFIHNRQNKGLH